MDLYNPSPFNPPMTGRFIVVRGGRDVLLTEAELRREAECGLLSPGDRVFHPRCGAWLDAACVPEVQAELREAEWLGRPPPPEQLVLVPANSAAVAGFVLAMLGYLPFLGLLPAGLGLYFSGKGLRVAQESYGSGHRLAVAGLVISVVCLVPQLLLTILTLYPALPAL